MDLQKWIDERTDEELPAVLSAVVRRMANGHSNGNVSFPICDASGSALGFFVINEGDEESPELLEELRRLEQLDEPEFSPDEALAMLKPVEATAPSSAAS